MFINSIDHNFFKFIISNLVTKLKKISIRTYFYARCVGGPKSTDFYPTIKPFLTNRGSNKGAGCDIDFLFFIGACSSIVLTITSSSLL
jgi:hypothetical protein